MKKTAALPALNPHALPQLPGPLGGPRLQEVVPPSATLGAAELPPTPQATPHIRRP